VVPTFSLDDHTTRELGLSSTRGADALLARLDTTGSPGGRQMLRDLLHAPLSSADAIAARQGVLRRLNAPARDGIRALALLTDRVRAYLDSGYLGLPLGRVARAAVLWRYPEMSSAIGEGLSVTRLFVQQGRAVVTALSQCHASDDDLADAVRDLRRGIDAVRTHAPSLGSAETRTPPSLASDSACRGAARPALMAALQAAQRLDALQALAAWSAQPGMAWPAMSDSDAAVGLHLERARSPLFDAAVPLDLRLPAGTRLVLVTGPNAAGKSTTLRTVAALVHLAHVGCAVPAISATVPVLRGLVSALHVSDDTRVGASRYVAELRRLRSLRDAGAAAGRFMAVIDEPLLGTSLTRGHATRRAVIEDLGGVSGGTWFIATHDLALAEALRVFPHVQCLAVTPWRAVHAGNAASLLGEGVAADADPAAVAAREYFRCEPSTAG
jgi:DNA mismatch repair ATPase MutS